jgi:hypothetical protein
MASAGRPAGEHAANTWDEFYWIYRGKSDSVRPLRSMRSSIIKSCARYIEGISGRCTYALARRQHLDGVQYLGLECPQTMQQIAPEPDSDIDSGRDLSDAEPEANERIEDESAASAASTASLHDAIRAGFDALRRNRPLEQLRTQPAVCFEQYGYAVIAATAEMRRFAADVRACLTDIRADPHAEHPVRIAGKMQQYSMKAMPARLKIRWRAIVARARLLVGTPNSARYLVAPKLIASLPGEGLQPAHSDSINASEQRDRFSLILYCDDGTPSTSVAIYPDGTIRTTGSAPAHQRTRRRAS